MIKFIVKQTATIMLLFVFNSINAQGIVNKWLIGYPGGGANVFIEFNKDSILSIDTVKLKMSFRDLNASICDSYGNMLFYTNGGWIANSTNDTMMNGNDLTPGPYASYWKIDGFRNSQGAVIIPFPADSTKYYLFHQTVDLASNGQTVIPSKNIFYSVIDMNLDGGLGAVTLKNNVILNDTLTYGALTICKHANGRDWWLLCHRAHSDMFFEFLISPTGISGPFSQSIGSILNEGAVGQACFSPDGKKYARYFPDDDLDIYDFDRCTGILSNPVHIIINDGAFCAGASFSANSKYLYISSQNYIYQFDVHAPNIELTKDTVAIYDGFASPFHPFQTYFYQSQLAFDRKIYISAPNSVDYLHVINYPDSSGISCDVQQHGIYLKTFNAFTIPNHPNYFLRADSGSVCDTLMLTVAQKNFENEDLNIEVFPNPAQNSFFINYQIKTELTDQFILYDTFGKEIKRTKLNTSAKTQKVNTDNLGNGIYFYKFKNQSGKIVIIK
ncbi:MAG: T9SS type A sorting domain-containing protein [Bacteroidetes bacterium]|nr:T9SS type A sorting domain-containing protein [Bacteroidota bacterium]MBP6414418.1 T9SS type A sorting domain-containing protein [Bacteroidia bacterium]